MGKIMKNKKAVELVTSLSLSCKICLGKFIFWSDPLTEDGNLKSEDWKGKKKPAKYSSSQE